MSKLVVLTHVFDESFLMPYWLRHHLRIFDYGIVVDYQCTDNTLEIVRDMAPHWKIVPARTDYFGAVECDNHIQDLERETYEQCSDRWVVALNTTEFLLHDDLPGLLKQHKKDDVKAMGVVLVDHPEQRAEPLDRPDLFSMKFFGRFDLHHQRLLHRKKCGHYSTGRHNWADEGLTPLQEDLFLLWFGWCPMNYIKERKLQIQKRIPQSDKERGFGWHHHMDDALLEKRYLEEVSKSYWLFSNPKYVEMLKKVHDRFNLGDVQFPQVELLNA